MDVRRDDLLRAAGDQTRRRSDRVASVEEEIRQAQAEALGRTGERLQEVLDRLGALDRHLDALLLDTAAEPGDSSLPDRIRVETETRNRLPNDYPVPGPRSLPGLATDPGRTP